MKSNTNAHRFPEACPPKKQLMSASVRPAIVHVQLVAGVAGLLRRAFAEQDQNKQGTTNRLPAARRASRHRKTLFRFDFKANGVQARSILNASRSSSRATRPSLLKFY